MQTELVDTFDQPTFVAPAPGRPRYLFVTEKEGTVRVLRDGVALERPFLDITDLVADQGEQGLLSIAFAPDYPRSRRFYLYFTADAGCANGCPIRVEEFKVRRDDPTRARRSSRRLVIAIPHQDAANHNGGTVAFGPDRMLWLATGDGGGGGDQYEGARNLNSLLGKLLRIDPVRRRNPSLPGHRVPRDNPFLGVPGRNQIWSYGLRNPFRFSFDEGLNAVAIGDVGQGNLEEVDIVTLPSARGAGFGWPEWEADFDYPESPDVHPARAAPLPHRELPEPGGRPLCCDGRPLRS